MLLNKNVFNLCKIFKKVEGFSKRLNDIIYHEPKFFQQNNDIVVYFGGDCQDYKDEMQIHSKKYTNWCLENISIILNGKFPFSHILIIRPARYESGGFSCYENFVEITDSSGAPKHSFNNDALKHLELLLENLIKNHLVDFISEKLTLSNIDPSNLNELLTKSKLRLIGFSKGCVVLNQILHEIDYVLRENKCIDFVKRFSEFYWLDGGHSGGRNTWITNPSILESFSKLDINVYIHVTPYQVKDLRRPWIGNEEEIFTKQLELNKVKVKRKLHFVNTDGTLENHFKVNGVI